MIIIIKMYKMIRKYICILNKNTKKEYPSEENWGFYVDIENDQSKIPTNEEILRIKYNLQNVNYIKKIKNIKNNISISISSDFEEHLDEKIDAIKNTNNYSNYTA